MYLYSLNKVNYLIGLCVYELSLEWEGCWAVRGQEREGDFSPNSLESLLNFECGYTDYPNYIC